MGKIAFVIFLYMFTSLFGFFSHRKLLDKKVRFAGLNNIYYPKGYIKPCNFIAERHNWRQDIPRFAYISAFIILLYPILFVISTLVYCLSGFKDNVGADMFLYGVLLVPGLNMLWMTIWGEIYSKGNQKQNNHSRKIYGLPTLTKPNKPRKFRNGKRH